MAEQRDRADEDPADPDRLRAAFVDAAPRTVEDVAAAAGVSPAAAQPGLETLAESGAIGRRSVNGVDISARKAAEAAEIDIEAPITLYHLTPSAASEGDTNQSGTDDEIGRRLDRMAIPGASDLMRSWRRDAVRATHDYLVTAAGATPEEIRSDVYSGHEAGFDDPGSWWEFVRPRLYRLPGVTVEDDEWFIEQRPAPQHG